MEIQLWDSPKFHANNADVGTSSFDSQSSVVWLKLF